MRVNTSSRIFVTAITDSLWLLNKHNPFDDNVKFKQSIILRLVSSTKKNHTSKSPPLFYLSSLSLFLPFAPFFLEKYKDILTAKNYGHLIYKHFQVFWNNCYSPNIFNNFDTNLKQLKHEKYIHKFLSSDLLLVLKNLKLNKRYYVCVLLKLYHRAYNMYLNLRNFFNERIILTKKNVLLKEGYNFLKNKKKNSV